MEIPAIKFGTDGWRGIIADDFTFNNMALVGSAVAQYLQETGQAGKPLLIGFDRRFAAEDFAGHLAAHLTALGQPVIVHDSPCPTPVLAYGVRFLQAAGAIMLTASHNPYYYQGFKFIPHFAGPAMPEATDRITAIINELAPAFNPPALAQRWKGERINLQEAYFSQLDQVINAHSFSGLALSVLYNPMHGVGSGYLDGYLRRIGVQVHVLNDKRDVYFGTNLPDPSEKNLALCVPKLIEAHANLLLANDGDADRFGLMDQEKRYFGANQALPLIADYLVRYKHGQGALVRTISTSHMLDSVAAKHGLELIETAVGFKYVGDILRQGALAGGEESGGVSIKGHIPEKDGILACLLLLEISATMGGSVYELYEQLQREVGARAFIRVDQELHEAEKQAVLGALRGFTDQKFAGKQVVERCEIDGVRLTFADGSWILVRPSGTEPLVRIYIEVTQPSMLDVFKAQVLDAVKSLASR
jgi:phosphomannomutase